MKQTHPLQDIRKQRNYRCLDTEDVVGPAQDQILVYLQASEQSDVLYQNTITKPGRRIQTGRILDSWISYA